MCVWVCGCVGVVYGGLHVVNTLLWGFRFPCSANRAILSRLYDLFYLLPSLFSLCRLYLSHTLSPTHTIFPFQIRESLYRKMVWQHILVYHELSLVLLLLLLCVLFLASYFSLTSPPLLLSPLLPSFLSFLLLLVLPPNLSKACRDGSEESSDTQSTRL